MDEIRALIRGFAAIGWRNRWFAVGLTWLVCLGGWAFVAALPNQYEANARIYVDSDAVLTPLLKGLALDNTRLNQVDILQRTLLSRPNLEKLISKTDLDLSIIGPADRESEIGRLASDIKVTPQITNLFTIAYRNSSPKLAYEVVQTILAIFVESKVGSTRTDMENARQFMQQQIARYEQQLQNAEARRAEFRSKYVDLLPSDAGGGASRLEMARSEVVTLTGQLTDLNARRELIKRELATTPPTLTFDAGGGAAAPGTSRESNAELKQAELALADLRLRETEQNPDVILARKRVDQLRASGLGAVSVPAVGPRRGAPPNPVYEHFKLQLVDIEASINSLKRQVDDATKERDRLEIVARGAPSLQAEFINLNRDYDVLYKNYNELLTRRESMRLAAAADNDAEKVKVQIIDPPQIPQNPVAPKRALLVSAVLGLGLAAGLGSAVLLHRLDRSFHSADELHVFGLPVAGSFSLIAPEVPVRQRVFAAVPFAMALLVLGAAYGGLVFSLLHIT